MIAFGMALFRTPRWESLGASDRRSANHEATLPNVPVVELLIFVPAERKPRTTLYPTVFVKQRRHDEVIVTAASGGCCCLRLVLGIAVRVPVLFR
jgi:hypothetical protein